MSYYVTSGYPMRFAKAYIENEKRINSTEFNVADVGEINKQCDAIVFSLFVRHRLDY